MISDGGLGLPFAAHQNNLKEDNSSKLPCGEEHNGVIHMDNPASSLATTSLPLRVSNVGQNVVSNACPRQTLVDLRPKVIDKIKLNTAALTDIKLSPREAESIHASLKTYRALLEFVDEGLKLIKDFRNNNIPLA